MKRQLLVFSIFALFVCISTLRAQQGVVSAGGEGSGEGGSMSFSAGQTDFMYFSSTTGSMQFGLQQVFFFEAEGVPKTRLLATEDLILGEDQCFDASQTIILAGGDNTFTVENGTGVELIAGQSILMLPGTTVEHGGYMLARITSQEGPFCDFEESIVASLQADEPDNLAYEEPVFIPDGIKNQKAFFRAYPNPTTGDLTIDILDHEMIGQSVTIEIINMRGEYIMRINSTGHFQQQLSMHGHQPGLYIIRVQSGHLFGTERIIKK